MYIIKKIISGKEYFYLRKSERKGKKVISKTIAYLGKNRKEAEKKLEEFKNRKISKPVMEKKVEIKENKEKKELTIDELAVFCKRKRFVFKSSEIYGGFSGFWDYGFLGVELFNNIKQDFWKFFVQEKENMLGIDSSIISHPKTWVASGHVASFKDVMGKCKKCKKLAKLEEGKCFCGGELEKVEDFNLMFETKVGAGE